jgi:hypothetical protein
MSRGITPIQPADRSRRLQIEGANVTTASPTYQPQAHSNISVRKLIVVMSVVLAIGAAILAVALSSSSGPGAADHSAPVAHATTYEPLIHYRGTGAPPVVQQPDAALTDTEPNTNPKLNGLFYGAR